MKEFDIKSHTCDYIAEIIIVNDLDLDNNLTYEKSYKNILIYDSTYKTPYGTKPLCFIFNEVDE